MFLLKSAAACMVSVITLFALAKLMGNKQISQLNMFDYINGITIGSIAAEMSISTSMREIAIAFVSMVIYAFVGFALSIMTQKSLKIRRFFTGKSTVLIKDGKIFRENLKQSKIDLNDVMTSARVKGYYNINDIECAILENNGEISFLPKSDKRPVSSSDLCLNPNLAIQPPQEGIIANVILDGVVLKQNLRHMGKNEEWLEKKLREQGFSNPADIFLATVDGNDCLSCYKQIYEKNNLNIFD